MPPQYGGGLFIAEGFMSLAGVPSMGNISAVLARASVKQMIDTHDTISAVADKGNTLFLAEIDHLFHHAGIQEAFVQNIVS